MKLYSEAVGLLAEKLAADPATATESRFYYNTVSKVLRYHNGTEWVDSDENAQNRFNGIENPADIDIAYDAGLRRFVLTYTGTVVVWVGGKKFLKTGLEVGGPHADATGKWYLYYDSTGTPVVSSTVWDLATTAPVALAYFRSSDMRALIFDERHPAGSGMPDAVHKYLHENVGTVLSTGALIADYTLNDNANLTYSISQATISDEDLIIDAPALADAANRVILWVDGAGGIRWNWTSNTYGIAGDSGVFPGANLPAGNIYYNNVAAGTLVAQSSNGNYVNYWPIALPLLMEVNIGVMTPLTNKYAVIMGQAVHTTVNAADATNPSSLLYVSNLTTEGNIFAKVMYARTAGTIRIKQDPTYYRVSVNNLAVTGFAPTDHQTLTNRSATGAHPASSISVDTAGFGGILTGAETDALLALQALDKKATGLKAVLDSNDRTLTEYESYLEMDTSGGDKLVGLPAAPFTGYKVTVLNSGTNVLTINATVSGVVGPTLGQWDAMTVLYNGSAWRQI